MSDRPKLFELPRHKEKLEPNEFVIGVLKDLLKSAKKGEIQSLVAVFTGKSEDSEGALGRAGHIVAPPNSNYELMMLMATLDIIKFEMCHGLWSAVDYQEVADDGEENEDDNKQE